MHPVGHVPDWHLLGRPPGEDRLEEVAAHLPVQAAHAVHRAAPADGEIRHVEGLRGVVRPLPPEGQQVGERDAELPLRVVAKVTFDERGGKPVEPGGHRGVCGEEIARSRDRQGLVERLAGRLHEVPGTLEHGQGRMPLVEVTDLRLQAERAKQAPSPQPQEHLLLEPQLRPPAVQLARDLAVGRAVHRVVAVQQVELHPANPHLPGAEPDRAARHGDVQAQPLSVREAQRHDRQLPGVVVRVEGSLGAVAVQHLAKVALLVEQPHTDHGHAQVAG